MYGTEIHVVCAMKIPMSMFNWHRAMVRFRSVTETMFRWRNFYAHTAASYGLALGKFGVFAALTLHGQCVTTFRFFSERVHLRTPLISVVV